MNFKEFLQENIVLLDGGMGTMLQEAGLPAGERPERWNLSRPDAIKEIHRSYFDAGSNVVLTNTFGANPFSFPDQKELTQIITSAVRNARTAAKESAAPQQKFVALDIGPTGKLLSPFGTLDFEDAVAAFAAAVRIGAEAGADLIFIETMNDSYETKAALLAAKENADLPVLVSNAYGGDGKLMTGADPAAMTALLEGLGAAAIGMNCSLGPDQLAPVARQYLDCASVPVLLKPNAGMPRREGDRTVFDVGPAEFAEKMSPLVQEGVLIVGGCCGTTPDHIRALSRALRGITPVPTTDKKRTVVSSYTHACVFSSLPLLIGERINPTGKKRFQQALREGDIDYILSEGLKQQEAGAHILDVNVGLPDIDEPEMLTEAVCKLQEVTDLPLQIDSSDLAAMERALRRYNGKALINSVNGKQESMRSVFPLMKKYGGVAVALTLDENGIPTDAEGRLAIARRIVATAAQYGVDKKDLVFDTLTMTVSADAGAARVTLDALRGVREKIGAHTLLGVSNVSFGLPARPLVNAAFFTAAMVNGLSAAILNPFSAEKMKAWHTFRVLYGLDEHCSDYIAFADGLAVNDTAATLAAKQTEDIDTLRRAVVKGFKDRAAALAAERLKNTEPLELVKTEIIPALDEVGKAYEAGKIYLPQLLMSAEAAQSAFSEVKQKMPPHSGGGKCEFVLATVKGDIHDIGKNIVRLLLENYGYDVIDLGRDVPPDVFVEEVVRRHAPLAGLSALMTTTTPAMEQTVALLKQKAPWCRVIVGGAVVTAEYAASIGADAYGADAMETVRYADSVICETNE